MSSATLPQNCLNIVRSALASGDGLPPTEEETAALRDLENEAFDCASVTRGTIPGLYQVRGHLQPEVHVVQYLKLRKYGYSS